MVGVAANDAEEGFSRYLQRPLKPVLPWRNRAHIAQAAKPALPAARHRVFVFFEPGAASPRQQAWQPALRARQRLISIARLFQIKLS
jgi:hypothetical protein